MCMIDHDFAPSIWRQSMPRARKSHRCEECRRTIEVGERHQYDFGVWEGHSYSFRTCAHCLAGVGWLVEVCNGWTHASLHEELLDHAQEYAHTGLARLVVGMRRGWKRFDGQGLMAVPAVPALPEGM